MNRIIELYIKLTDKNKWIQCQADKSKYKIKWNKINENIENAKKYKDFSSVQKLNIELFWLISIREYDYKKEVIRIRQEENFFYWATQPYYNFEIGLDSKKIYNSLYVCYNENDIVAPSVFDVDNEKHKLFAFKITGQFESAHRKAKFEGLAKDEQNLPFPKPFIYNALTFFSLFSRNYEIPIESDYPIELRDSLESFV